MNIQNFRKLQGAITRLISLSSFFPFLADFVRLQEELNKEAFQKFKKLKK